MQKQRGISFNDIASGFTGNKTENHTNNCLCAIVVFKIVDILCVFLCSKQRLRAADVLLVSSPP